MIDMTWSVVKDINGNDAYLHRAAIVSISVVTGVTMISLSNSMSIRMKETPEQVMELLRKQELLAPS
jgi:hypothetical protein